MKLNKSHNIIITKIVSIQSSFNGCIFECRTVSTNEKFKVKGSDLNIDVTSLTNGMPLILSISDVDDHPRFGRTYTTNFIEHPFSKKKSVKILNQIPSIGDKKSNLIYQSLSPFAIETLLEDIDVIDNINGLTSKNKQYIKKWFYKNGTYLSEQRSYLNFGFSYNQFLFIKNTNMYRSFKDYLENPYSILDYIHSSEYFKSDDDPSFSFKDIDNCVIKNNILIDPATRCNYAIDYVFRHYLPKQHPSTSGSTMFTMDVAINILTEILSIDNLTTDMIKPLIRDHESLDLIIVDDEDDVSPWSDTTKKHYYIHNSIRQKERYIYDYLRNNKQYTVYDHHLVDTIIFNDNTEIKLDKFQYQAISHILKNQYSILTGGPGTGKTTVLNAIIQSFRIISKNKIYGFAPTAKAVNRMKESIGIFGVSCNTISSLTHPNAINKINKRSFIIVDESSMIDTNQMYQFLSKIPDSCRILFVGDYDQLPPIGYGQVFKDLITYNLVPTHRLHKTHRQKPNSKETSDIIQLCSKIKNKEIIRYFDSDELTMIDTLDVHTTLIDYLNEIRKSNTTTINLNELTIVTPYTSSQPISTFNINRSIHHMFNNKLNSNDNHKSITVGKNSKERTFIEGDRVINTQNKRIKTDSDEFYKLANGEIGRIISIIHSDEHKYTIIVEFDELIYKYTQRDIDTLEHAYAISVHKSQGSEFVSEIVLLPDYVTPHNEFLVRNLLYTAVSRAKNHLTIIGPSKSLSQMVQNKMKDRVTYFNYLCDNK